MKRDMELVRQILLVLEAAEEIDLNVDFHMEGVSDPVLFNHVHLMAEAGLIDAMDLSTMSGPCWAPRRITWSGHDFLDKARDDTRWNKMIVIAKEIGVPVTIDTAKDILDGLIKSAKAAIGM